MKENWTDYSEEVCEIIQQVKSEETERRKWRYIRCATVLLALVLLFGGYSFIKVQLAPFEGPLLEHRILTYIDISDEERMPPELIDALIAEYVPEHLKHLEKYWGDETPRGDVNSRQTAASREIKEKFRSIPNRTGIHLSARHGTFGVYRYIDHVSILIRDFNDFSSHQVGYTYYPDGNISKWIEVYNGPIRMCAINYDGKITISCDLFRVSVENHDGVRTTTILSQLALPDQEISVEDYHNYMEARKSGKVCRLISVDKILEFADRHMNTGN